MEKCSDNKDDEKKTPVDLPGELHDRVHKQDGKVRTDRSKRLKKRNKSERDR